MKIWKYLHFICGFAGCLWYGIGIAGLVYFLYNLSLSLGSIAVNLSFKIVTEYHSLISNDI